jgi:hypothetical protein
MKHCFSTSPFLRRFFKTTKLNPGFSIVEVLIASAIILTNLGVISSAVVQYGEVSRKQRIVTLAMGVESALHSAVSDPGTYNDVNIDSMVLGAGFHATFQLVLRGAPLPDITVAAFPYSNFFTDGLTPCAGPADFSNRNCVLRIEIDRLQVAATPPTYAFAYRIRINPSLQIQMQNLGVSQDDAFTTTRPLEIGVGTKSDYNLYVPQYILMTNDQTLCSTTAAGTTTGLTGFDSNTGRGHCLKRPEAADVCNGNQIAKGLRVIPDAGNFKMVLICVPAQQFTCGLGNLNASFEDYSMRIMDARSFDSDFYAISPGPLVAPAVPNRCIYTSESPSTYTATFTSAPNMRGLNATGMCPRRYNPVGTGCSFSAVSQPIQGSCECCDVRDFYGACTSSTTRYWNTTTQGFSPATITPQDYPASTDSVSCTLSDTSPIPASCTAPGCDLVGAVTRPTVRGTISFQPTCQLDGVTPAQIDAGAL